MSRQRDDGGGDTLTDSSKATPSVAVRGDTVLLLKSPAIVDPRRGGSQRCECRVFGDEVSELFGKTKMGKMKFEMFKFSSKRPYQRIYRRHHPSIRVKHFY